MRIFVSLLAIIVLGATAVQLYDLQKKKNLLEAEYARLNKQTTEMFNENIKLEADLRYFNDPSNLEKEARLQLNYASPGEKLIIVVPKKSPN